MSTLRVSNIEAKADASSPTIDEKVRVTSSQGRVLVQIDGKTAGITSIGINTTGTSFTIDANQNVQFAGIITAANVNTTGVTTFSSGIVVSAGSTAAPSISPSGDSNTGIFFPAPDTVAIGEGGVEALRINSSGNLGIGTNNPILGKCEIHSPGSTNHLVLKDTTNNWISKIQISTGGTFTIKSGDTEIFNIGSTGILYKNANQIYPILQVVSSGDITGAVDLGATTTSYTDIKTFASFTPKKSGSLVYVILQVQTWWGSTVDGNSTDVYARIQQNSSGSYSTFYENNRLAGNFLYDKRYLHDTKHMIGVFNTSSTNLTSLKLQAMYSGNNTSAFNFFHSTNGSSCLIIEFDVA